MSSKRRALTYTIIMLIPAALILVLSVLLIGVFSFFESDIEYLLTDRVLVSAPPTLRLVVVWAIVGCLIGVVSGIYISRFLLRRLIAPIETMTEGVEHLKNGDLNYEFAGADDKNLNELCVALENLRLRLQKNVRTSLKNETEQKMLLANISHDIRTPITSIKGYVEGIRDGVADTYEKREHYLRTIYLKAEAIEQMTDNLSIYSKLELGRVQYSREPMDITTYLTEVADEFTLDLQTAGVELSLKIPKEPIYIVGDHEKLRRVFANIITNTIKYKKCIDSKLDISAERIDKGVIITFSDNGKGISEKELPHIFDGFYRADPSRNNKIEGNGLGLSISRRIISDHGGKLWARSEENKGTEMIIFLPEIKSRKGRNADENTDYRR